MLEFFGFIWSAISSLISTIKYIIGFLTGLLQIIPKTLSFLPNEISTLLLTAITIISAVFIYKFIK